MVGDDPIVLVDIVVEVDDDDAIVDPAEQGIYPSVCMYRSGRTVIDHFALPTIVDDDKACRRRRATLQRQNDSTNQWIRCNATNRHVNIVLSFGTTRQMDP
jgi:hypothetical protein